MVHVADRHKPLLFQKVAIFVDAENIELSGWKHHHGRTDYKKVLSKVGDREIVRILYYKPIYKEISNTFSNFWASLGGEIRRPQKNADSFLIIDAVTLSEKIDVAIILGGDKDFLPLMWYLKSRGCRVEIWSWPEATSPEVQEQADFYFPLTKDYVIPETEEKSADFKAQDSRQGTEPAPEQGADRHQDLGLKKQLPKAQPPTSSNARSPHKVGDNKTSRASGNPSPRGTGRR